MNSPRKAQVVERLDPQFLALQTLFEARAAALQSSPASVAPELVLVLETSGPAKELLALLSDTPGLSWLAEGDLRDLDPDEHFFDKKNPLKPVTACLYLIMTNQEALAQLLSVWSAWKAGKRVPPELSDWLKAFGKLREIRRWGVKDRLSENGVLDAWRERVALGGEMVSVEIELWFRQAAAREQAISRIQSYVRDVGGEWVSTCLHESIAHHAALVRLPIATVERILDNHEEIELLQCDEVRLFRSVGQSGAPVLDESECVSPSGDRAPPEQLGPPVVALLDGLPLENHVHLRDRLIVDDPDGWSERYPARSRGHGTAMASLVLHGDLGAREAASKRRVYVRPILRPASFGGNDELAPEDELWVDLIHRAVRRVVAGAGAEAPAASSVCVFNLSVGDSYQPFLHSLSPLARMLDWLSWTYKVLFIVSAGNHNGTAFDSAGPPTAGLVLKAITENHRNHRILSPAESINALTVGATPHDAAGEWHPPTASDTLPTAVEGMPSVVSALGRGFRRAVKPDVLAPGGRVVLTEGFTPGRRTIAVRPRFPPGQRVASPGRAGDLTAFRYSFGTSNAAALTSRLAAEIYDALADLHDEPNASELGKVAPALWLKALIVHAASWPKGALNAASDAIKNEFNKKTLRDEATAILGYGALDGSRVLACSAERATVLASGSLKANATEVHQVPLPPSLHAHATWRRLTITLAYFTPIRPNNRKYRVANVYFTPPPQTDNVLRVDRTDVNDKAVRRGTVQHEVLVAAKGAIDFAPGGVLRIPVTCLADAGTPEETVDYAMAITLEVAEGVNTRIYDEVRSRLHIQVPIRPG